MFKFHSIIVAILCLLFQNNIALCDTFSNTIGSARTKNIGETISVAGTITLLTENGCYIESTDRAAGIRVLGNITGATVGNALLVTGTIGAMNGDLIVQSNSVTVDTSSTKPISPVGMSNKWIGGCGQTSLFDYKSLQSPPTSPANWTIRAGISSMGLLVKTWGKVTSVYYSPATDTHWFYIDDNFGAIADFGDKGVLVYSDVDVKIGDFVTVTGVAISEPSFDDPSRLVRAIATQGANDVVSINLPEIVYPFSDEFDGPVLDKRWMKYKGSGTFSCTVRPGWLTISLTERSYTGNTIFQPIKEDCNIEIKLELGGTDIETSSSYSFACRNETQNALATFGFNSNNQLAGRSVYFGDIYNSPKTIALQGNTCYLKLRRRENTTYGSVSFNGSDYLPEVTIPSQINYFAMAANYSPAWGKQPPYKPFEVYIDYIRISPASNN